MTEPTSEAIPGPATSVAASKPAKRRRKRWVIAGILLTAVGLGFRLFCGFYSVQPIGALPQGATAIVWRAKGEPFFNSPDALCIERIGGVSLMCRAMAAREAPTDRIVLRLPYQAWTYSASTGGRDFDR